MIVQGDAVLPVNPYEYEKVCDVAVTQLGTYNAPSTYVGMGYLIRLEVRMARSSSLTAVKHPVMTRSCSMTRCYHENFFPAIMRACNDVSIVVDAVVKGEIAKNPVRTGETPFAWLANITEGNQNLIRMYGEDMRCDVMQIAHHGIGCPHYDLYVPCHPSFAYWSCGTRF